MTSRLHGAFLLGLLFVAGCASTQPARDDVGRIPDRLVSGIMTVKSAEIAFVEQKQALLDAVATRKSSQIPPVENAVGDTIATLNKLGQDANWVPAQRDLLAQTVTHYQAYFSEYSHMARLWIVEQPGRPEDSGLAEQEKKLRDQEEQVRNDLKKLADMMAWELTRKIDTVNSLILKNP